MTRSGGVGFAALAALVLLAPDSAAQPLGAAFRVDSNVEYPTRSAVGVGAFGSFVVVWDGEGDVFGQRYSSSGANAGLNFRVNAGATGSQRDASVAVGASGDFVVAFSGDDGSTGTDEILARRFDSLGAPIGGDFRVNTATTGDQTEPALAMEPTGEFVVVWTGPDGADSGVFGQRIRLDGTPNGGEFRVNASTTGRQRSPAVAVDVSGGFVVAWTDNGQGLAGEEVFARRFASSGAPLTGAFRVNGTTTGDQLEAALGIDASGSVLVAWSGSPAGAPDVFARRYASSGAPVGTEFRVNTTTSNGQRSASVAPLGGGGFLVVWAEDVGFSAAPADVFGQRISRTGAFVGSQIAVSANVDAKVAHPAVAASTTGFVVAWTRTVSGESESIQGQRFNTQPVVGDADGSAVVSVADVFFLISFLFAGGPAPL